MFFHKHDLITFEKSKISYLTPPSYYTKLVGARGRRPLWSPPWVPVTFGHCFLFFLIFYSLFFTALPCPAPTLPCPALRCPCPALFRIFLLLPGIGGESYTGNGQCLFFLLMPRTGGGSYSLISWDLKRKGMGFFWDMGFRTWTDRWTDGHTVLTVPKTCEVNEKKSKRRTDRYTHTMFVIIYRIWLQPSSSSHPPKGQFQTLFSTKPLPFPPFFLA
jgi:hypothetical protein